MQVVVVVVVVKIMLRFAYLVSIGLVLYYVIMGHNEKDGGGGGGGTTTTTTTIRMSIGLVLYYVIMGNNEKGGGGGGGTTTTTTTTTTIRSVDDDDHVVAVTRDSHRVVQYDEIHLIQQWYYDKNSTRFEELKEVLRRNLLNEHITQIHFIQEPHSLQPRDEMAHKIFGSDDSVQDTVINLFRKKVAIAKSRERSVRRLYMSDAFKYASKYLQGRIVMVSNLDIYYDDTLQLLKNNGGNGGGENIDLSHYVSYFLSRYEPIDNHDQNQCDRSRFIGSHDTFIVIPPVPAVLLDKLESDGLYQGSWGIEARLMYEFEQIGIKVRNPCLSVKSWHMHHSGVKNEWMPEVNTENRSRVAWPDYLEAVYEK
ncbi:hypothetical protein MP638_001087 [Amoeboaphelidium occidentale]|nr:hypothetical protein MP638_001087 [Amoeboaphelidium occidentale]